MRGRRIRCGGDRGTRNGNDGVLMGDVEGWVVELALGVGG